MNDCSFGCIPYKDKVGIVVAQLGTPDAPTGKALKPYLKQFLSDRRVIEKNRFLWWVILNGIILRVRPKKSAELYARIWSDEGSPLLVTTNQQAAHLKKALHGRGVDAEVEVGMRYGTPSIESAVETLLQKGCARLLLYPMYPQYAAATTASTYDAFFGAILKERWVPTVKVVQPYYLHQAYLRAQAGIINEYLANTHEKPEKLVFSYHGIPEEYILKGDPYCCMCVESTESLRPLINFPDKDIIHTFQSRFGRDPWLEPYTDETIKEIAEAGVKRVAVVCPGFVADCLETLDEIGNEAREEFEEHGGEHLELIPCLNTHPMWLNAMTTIAEEELGTWTKSAPRTACAECPHRKKKGLD